MKYNMSSICRTANALSKQGYTRSQSFHIAWAVAKGTITKVSGTSRHQTAIEHLMKYHPQEIRFYLERDKHNRYDENAVSVFVTVNGSKPYQIGYIPREAAPVVSIILSTVPLKTQLKAIVGGYLEGMRRGLRLELSL